MKKQLYEIIFEADTKAGKIFDIVLIFMIIISVTIVMLESLPDKSNDFYETLNILEWIVTSVFLIEYILRLWIVPKPLKYAFSTFGIIDFVAIIPSFLGILISGSYGLMMLRSLRLLRIFRILKLSRYLDAGEKLKQALLNSRNKISVFLFTITILVFIMGSLMYIIECNQNSGFTSIPKSIYWSIVTLTTVGYGDIAPVSALGQALASIIMIMGYAIIAVPTGIVTSELTKNKSKPSTQVCPNCMKEGHDNDAVFCKYCGGKINE